MSRRRSRRRDYNARYEDRRASHFYEASEVIRRTSSPWDEFDTLVTAAPPVAPIHRLPGLDPGDLMSLPAPISLPEATSWQEYPPIRATFAQEPRRGAVGPSGPGYSLPSLLRPFFRDPERTAACVRRKERREVIFAKTGGGRGMPPRERKPESEYSC